MQKPNIMLELSSDVSFSVVIDLPHGYSKRTLIAVIIRMWVLFEGRYFFKEMPGINVFSKRKGNFCPPF